MLTIRLCPWDNYLLITHLARSWFLFTWKDENNNRKKIFNCEHFSFFQKFKKFIHEFFFFWYFFIRSNWTENNYLLLPTDAIEFLPIHKWWSRVAATSCNLVWLQMTVLFSCDLVQKRMTISHKITSLITKGGVRKNESPGLKF